MLSKFISYNNIMYASEKLPNDIQVIRVGLLKGVFSLNFKGEFVHVFLRTYVQCVHNSYLPVIGVHEMHGRMHPNYWQITILLVVGLLYDNPTPSHNRQIAYKNFGC